MGLIYALDYIKQNGNYIYVNELYVAIAKTFEIEYPSKVKTEITNAIQHRNDEKSIENFESILDLNMMKKFLLIKDL